MFNITGWLSTNLLATVTSFRRLNDSSPGYTLSVYFWKFSDDYRDCVTWTSTVPMSGIRANALPEVYWKELCRVGFGLAIDRVPVTGRTVADSYATVRSGELPQLTFSKIMDRSYLFSGVLNPDWGDLAYDCYSQIQLWNSNAIAYGKDLTMITAAAKDLVASVKSLLLQKDAAGAAKHIADLFLSCRYGWYLSAVDTMSLLTADYDAAYPEGRCKRSSMYTYFRRGYTIEARMSVYCRPYSDSISDLASLLQMFDVELTLENIWDLIPYSFVVDWVVNVGDTLSRLDMCAQLDRFKIFLTGQTLKVTTQLAADKIPQLKDMIGHVNAKSYKRVYKPDVVIPPSLASSRNSDQNFKHWIEGSALAIQRVR
jgi:hypothetical protein